MKILFAPAVWLNDRLRFPQKFFLTGLVFFLPLLVVSWLLVDEIDGNIDLTAQERLGVEYIPLLRQPIEAIQSSTAA